ncbi:MAG TPA: hypothetical protein VEZ42_07005 [Pseudonocardia sp.]|nr:hypothetical protein [Pseudonocardia sp.]
MGEGTWFYCLQHNTVEQVDGCRAMSRLGPYPDRETAARAVDLARENTEREDRRDAEWDGWPSGPGPGDPNPGGG